MKHLIFRVGLYTMAAFLVIAGTTLAHAQGHEFVVGGQVVSDEVTAPADSYVGDLTMNQAGCSSCGGGKSGRASILNLFGGCRNDCGGYVPRGYGRPDLFYNYYTQGNYNQANAQMYISPLPTPPNVGHTFFTYQPFYPHELLYWHKDRFHNYYDSGRGMNRTRAVYYSPPVRQAMKNFYWNKLRLPR